MTRRRPLEARTMFLAGGSFAVLLAIAGTLGLLGRRADQKLLETGRRTTVTVLSKHKDFGRKSKTKAVEIRLDEVPGEAPFFRTLRGQQWEEAQPGGTLPYVYDPADPRGGVLGTPMSGSEVSCFFAAGLLLVVPLLIVGVVLKLRERKLKSPSSS